MNFEQFMEEWKPFPKDKVNRQIDKKEKDGDSYTKRQAHVMKGVKNYKTKSTDFTKADQKFVGRDREPNREKEQEHRDRAWKHHSKASKHLDKGESAQAKGKDKKAAKHGEKAEAHRNKLNKHAARSATMQAIRRSSDRATRDEDKQQAEINKKSKEDRAKAKRMMDVTKLEKAHKKPAVKGATKGGFKEHMNFTDYVDSLATP